MLLRAGLNPECTDSCSASALPCMAVRLEHPEIEEAVRLRIEEQIVADRLGIAVGLGLRQRHAAMVADAPGIIVGLADEQNADLLSAFIDEAKIDKLPVRPSSPGFASV